MVKAVIFDMDGVILDSHDAWFYIFQKAIRKFEGKDITMGEFDDNIWAQAFEEISRYYFSTPICQVRKYYEEIYPEFKQRVKAMRYAAESLEALRQKGILLGVASNTQKGIVGRVLEAVGLKKYFSIILGGDSVQKGKPAPDMILKAIEELNLIKEDVIFIGDALADKMAAEAAGVSFIGFRQDADIRIDELIQLKELVR